MFAEVYSQSNIKKINTANLEEDSYVSCHYKQWGRR